MTPDSDGTGVAAGHLREIDLVIFDKDGTLLDFHGMWGGWALRLGEALEAIAERPIDGALREAFGVTRAGEILPHGALAAMPMARLHELATEVLIGAGLPPSAAARALDASWDPPDPVALAVPLTDLPALLGGLRASGRRVAIATADDRVPTERTLAALGVDGLVDALVCADDGLPSKPAPDAVLEICRRLRIAPARAAVVGDSPADIAMGRAAGVGLTIGVASGVSGMEALAGLADVALGSVADLLPGGPVS